MQQFGIDWHAGALCTTISALLTAELLLQNLLDSRAQMAGRGVSDHTADLLRMTRESMNGSFTSKITIGVSLFLPLMVGVSQGHVCVCGSCCLAQ